jgi:3-methyladenine DNA glycosylase AlkC
MIPDELRAILSQREGLKLDFKREYKFSKTPPSNVTKQKWKEFVDGQWDEFIKDVLALTNGNVGTSEESGMLIIGAGDDRDLQPDGTRPLFDMRHLELTSKHILEKVNSTCYPPIPNILYEEIELDEKVIGVVTIPPTTSVHETTRRLTPKKGVVNPKTEELVITGNNVYTERTAFIRRGENIYSATEAERRSLAADKSPETFIIASPSLAVDEFIITESEKEKVRSIFVMPRGGNSANQMLARNGRLWLIGPSGLWKRYFAVFLAMGQGERTIYRIPRFVDWQQLAETDIRDSAIFFPDALGQVDYEKEKIESEFKPWVKLLAKGNMIIATSPDDVFAEAAKEARWLELVSREGTFFLSPDSFDYKAKTDIFRRLVQYFHSKGTIDDYQRQWALGLFNGAVPGTIDDSKALSRAQLERLLRETWLPVDIERFINKSLPEAHTEEELFDLLRRDADIDTRIHSWFIQLDDPTRAFVLSLTLFAGRETKLIWESHKEIVHLLRSYDPALSILPLGILRQRAQPYVTAEGPPEFINPRVFKVVLKEVAKSYREYFTEIIPLLKDWSVRDFPTTMSKEERDNWIEETEETRNAIARMTGEVGKLGLEDVSSLLESWAKHQIGRIGKTAGLALRDVAMDPASAHHALRLLNDWSSDFSSQNAEFRRWASASALGRIASIKSRFGVSQQALAILQRLAEDPDDYVVSAVSHAFRMIGAALPIESMAGTLTRLAKRSRVYTRQQVARAVDEVLSVNAESAYNLLEVWASSGNSNVRWTAIYILLVGRRLGRTERYTRLSKLIVSYPNLFASALEEALRADADESRETAISGLKNLTSQMLLREQLITALSKVYETDPISTQKLLSSISGALGNTDENLQLDVHMRLSEIAIRTLLIVPDLDRHPHLVRLLESARDEFANVVIETLKIEKARAIDWSGLESLAGPPPNGDIILLASMLANVYLMSSSDMQGLLSRLCKTNPLFVTIQGLVHKIVPVEAIRTLISEKDIPSDEKHPCLADLLKNQGKIFVEVLGESLSQQGSVALDWSLLGVLASPSNSSSRDDFIRELVNSYKVQPAATQRILTFLSNAPNEILRDVQFEVLAKVPREAIDTLLSDPTIPEIDRQTYLIKLMSTDASEFARALKAGLLDTNRKSAVVAVLNSLVGTTSEERRNQLVVALIHAYKISPNETQELLRLLSELSVHSLSMLESEVHSHDPIMALKELLIERKILLSVGRRSPSIASPFRSNALAFKRALQKALDDTSHKDLFRATLSSLIMDTPKGLSDEVVSSLAEAYKVQPEDTQRLLSNLSVRLGRPANDVQEKVHQLVPELATSTLLTASHISRAKKYFFIGKIVNHDVGGFLSGFYKAFLLAARTLFNGPTVSFPWPEVALIIAVCVFLVYLLVLLIAFVISFF